MVGHGEGDAPMAVAFGSPRWPSHRGRSRACRSDWRGQWRRFKRCRATKLSEGFGIGAPLLRS
jgi:hypothetical protein